MRLNVSYQAETILKVPLWIRVLVWIGFPLLGLGAGWLLRRLADWVAGLPWAPFKGPAKLLAMLPEPWGTIGMMVVGAMLGLAISYVAEWESPRVTIGDDLITITRADSTRTFKRSQVRAAFLDGNQLVLLDPDTAELARESSDLDARQLRAALITHGYLWVEDGDPHKNQYRRWIEETPELPSSTNALLKARARALEKKDREDATELRAQLNRLDVVVRDENKGQYWRATRRHEASERE